MEQVEDRRVGVERVRPPRLEVDVVAEQDVVQVALLVGRDAERPPLIAELKQAIRELENPIPEVISAYAKFAGDNSAMERAAKAREKAGFLRSLLSEIDR